MRARGSPSAGKYAGPAGVAEFFQKLGASEDVTQFEHWEYFTNGDDVVAYGHEACTIRANGNQAATNGMMLFRVRDGKVTRWESFYDTYAYARAHRG